MKRLVGLMLLLPTLVFAQTPPETWFTENHKVGTTGTPLPAGTILAKFHAPETRVYGITAKCSSAQAGVYWFTRNVDANGQPGAVIHEQEFAHVALSNDAHPTVVNVTVNATDWLLVTTAIPLTGTFSCSIHVTTPVQQ